MSPSIDANDSNGNNEPIVQPNETTKAFSRYCEVCNVSVNSDIHLQLHLNGSRHSKKLRQIGAPPYAPPNDTLSHCFMLNYEHMLNGNRKSKEIDYSEYRTPSGQYYCKVCNIALLSEVLLSQHFGSKKHIKTAAAAKAKTKTMN